MGMFKSKAILIIDDSQSIRTFLRISFESHRAAFYEAGTGREGLRLAGEHHPDLVVLDLGLPDMDGLQVLPLLKQMERPPFVLVLTVRKEREVKDKAFSLGADAYLSKPFLVEDLIEQVENLLFAK